MHKLALKAIAQLTHVDIANAVHVVRTNPLLEDEINIEEELINLQESLHGTYAAGDTLYQYPAMQQHVVAERRLILKHCIGLIARMLHGKSLPRPYNQEDTIQALRKLVQLIVEDAQRTGKRLDAEAIRMLKPFMSFRQRVAMRQWGLDMMADIVPLYRLQPLLGRFSSLRPGV